jgi:beta-lactam-binding protein with PASTA domain
VRMRRHTGPGITLPGAPGRRFVRDIALVALTAGVGYFVSSYWVAPGAVGGDDTALPRVIGASGGQARRTLAAARFRVRFEAARPSPTVPRGSVMWQDPPPGTVLSPNAVVQLALSEGPAPVTVPDVIGMAAPSARRVIEAAGIRVGRMDTVRGGGPETGVVLATRPSPGNGRPRGAPVDLVVSGGPRGPR